jgi:hypothetical protein
MNLSPEQKFIAALDICQSLAALKYQKTHLTFEAIKLFCESAKDPANFLTLRHQYAPEIAAALKAVEAYATSVDNWRVDCEIGFGVKDHCNIISFFLNFPTGNFTRFSGNLATPEIITELIADWQGIDLAPLVLVGVAQI